MSLRSWPRPPSTTTISSIVSKILDARYNEQEMFHELLVAWRGFPVGEATWEPYSVMGVVLPPGPM
jgi:Chromo (CHRromatin Organisation MOdifier) domain